MTNHRIANPPPGFDKLSRDEQIEYVQRLWNHIADDHSELTVPEWHREILRERRAKAAPENASTWDEVKQRLENRPHD